MNFQKSSLLLLVALFAADCWASADFDGPLTKRAACNADNALRNFRDKRYSSSASEFCSVWLQSTKTNTLSVTASASATATDTPEPKTATETIVVTITDIETTVTTAYPTAENTFVKRGEIPYPDWLSATFPPARISSACSCFVSAPSPIVTVTATTTVATSTDTTTTTLPPLTNTDTKFITETAFATSTVVNEGPAINCGVTGCNSADGFLGQAEVSTVEDCKSFCQGTSGCQTFQFSQSLEYCNAFSSAISDIRSSGCEVYQFFDVKCII